MLTIDTSHLVAGVDLRPRQIHHIAKPHSIEDGLKKSIEEMLLPSSGGDRRLPATLMYDKPGLELWAKIVDLPDYYIPQAEMDSLDQWSAGLVRELGEGKALIDLGSGDVRKVLGLLGEFEKAKCTVYYFALDMSADQLEENMRRIPRSWRHVHPFALCGTFEQVRAWSRRLTVPKCFLSLGATVGNDQPTRMVDELSRWSSLLGPDDRMLIGTDSNQDEAAVLAAYNDKDGVWHSFIANGFLQSNRVLGAHWFRREDWKIYGVVERTPAFRHQFVAEAVRPVDCPSLGLNFKPGDRIVTYPSHKYSAAETLRHFAAAGLEPKAMWRARHVPVYQYLLASSDGPVKAVNGNGVY